MESVGERNIPIGEMGINKGKSSCKKCDHWLKAFNLVAKNYEELSKIMLQLKTALEKLEEEI